MTLTGGLGINGRHQNSGVIEGLAGFFVSQPGPRVLRTVPSLLLGRLVVFVGVVGREPPPPPPPTPPPPPLFFADIGCCAIIGCLGVCNDITLYAKYNKKKQSKSFQILYGTKK
ncbi:hypothetical protein DERP_007190 [Dermatophagoides pteronyssinus]|uniref:Uncharacterized protein n=1 Tax=Dermatophagoides pteronyssinus TaxID=6956 RepID=A0ABQ8JV11_DERPT|nr:hypothetical protein DERP_007190 [Dermatophagoides pteronyssinus]